VTPPSSDIIALAVLAAALFAANVGGLRDRVFHRASAPGIHSLAVLPLENLSGDTQQEYFADGMTEELTTELSQVSSLRIVSRTSAMRYKGMQKSVPEIVRDRSPRIPKYEDCPKGPTWAEVRRLIESASGSVRMNCAPKPFSCHLRLTDCEAAR